MDFKFIFNLQLFAEGEEGKGDPSEGGEGGKPPATDPETKKVDVDSEEFIDYRDCEYDESAHDDVTVEYRIMFCGPGIYGIAFGENAEAGEIRNIDAIKKDIELTIKVV